MTRPLYMNDKSPKKILKVPWADFVKRALQSLADEFPFDAMQKVRFTKHSSYEGDIDCYEIPDNVEIELK